MANIPEIVRKVPSRSQPQQHIFVLTSLATCQSKCSCSSKHPNTLLCANMLASFLQLFTKAWTAGLLNGLGDLVSQKFVEKNDDLDFKRLGIFTLLVRHPSVSVSL